MLSILMYVVVGAFVLFVLLPRFRNLAPGRKAELRGLAEGGALLLDVRSVAEHSGGHIFSSLNIPVQELAGRLSELPKDKNIPIIVYCASGMRSGSAATILQASGYKNVTNGGGYSDLAAILGD